MLRQWRAAELLLLLRERREEGEARATEWREGSGGAGRCPDQGGWRWPAAARPTPAYGRHVAVAGWGEAGAARGRERGGWAEREAGLAQQRLSPYLFFLNLFSQFLSKFIWTI